MSGYVKVVLDISNTNPPKQPDIIKCKGVDYIRVRHGRWEHDGSEWKYRFLCSECGYKLMDVPTNYCPNCGARMDEKEQENERI